MTQGSFSKSASILIVSAGAVEACREAGVDVQTIRLPHPAMTPSQLKGAEIVSAESTLCEFLIVGQELLELQRIQQQPSSWMLDNHIHADGSVLVATRIDPLFLALPILSKCPKTDENRLFVSIDDLFVGVCAVLRKMKGLDLNKICDTKEIMGETLFRLNDRMVLDWLKRKVERVIQRLTGDDVNQDSRSLLLDSIGSVCEYLSPAWEKRLLEDFSLTVEELSLYEKPVKRTVSVEQSTGESAKKNQKIAPVQKKRATKKRKPEDTKGMRSLKSFFGVKKV